MKIFKMQRIDTKSLSNVRGSVNILYVYTYVTISLWLNILCNIRVGHEMKPNSDDQRQEQATAAGCGQVMALKYRSRSFVYFREGEMLAKIGADTYNMN